VDVLGLTADELDYFNLPDYSLISSYCKKKMVVPAST
jgi:hypothetical protein